MGLRWCLGSLISQQIAPGGSLWGCVVYRESQTGWCRLHCGTAVFKDTGKRTPVSLPRNMIPYSHAEGRRPGQEGKWRSQTPTETLSYSPPLSDGIFTLKLLVKIWVWLMSDLGSWDWFKPVLLLPLEDGGLGWITFGMRLISWNSTQFIYSAFHTFHCCEAALHTPTDIQFNCYWFDVKTFAFD